MIRQHVLMPDTHQEPKSDPKIKGNELIGVWGVNILSILEAELSGKLQRGAPGSGSLGAESQMSPSPLQGAGLRGEQPWWQVALKTHFNCAVMPAGGDYTIKNSRAQLKVSTVTEEPGVGSAADFFFFFFQRLSCRFPLYFLVFFLSS